MRLVLAGLIAFLLSGCMTAGKRGGEHALTVYDLGPPAVTALTTMRQPALAIEVKAPLWIDSMGIEYRLAYIDSARLREYARARWAGPPTQLIQQRLVQQLGGVANGQTSASCVLRFEITEFSQIFDTPEISRSVLQGRLQWLDKRRVRLAEQTINLSNAAPTADAQGGVRAFSISIEQLTEKIKNWEKERVASGQINACGV